jgi:phenylalanyl-tRNA synthetase alpha chain
MLDKLNEIEKTALESLSEVTDQTALEAWRVANVGRSSPLMLVFSGLGKLSKEERPVVGSAANRVKVALEAALTERAEAIKAAALAKSLEEEQLDVTLPGRGIHLGRLHPSTQQLRRVLDILADMGFQVYTSRGGNDEINFSCNFAPDHPAICRIPFVEAGERGENPLFCVRHIAGQITPCETLRRPMDPENPPPMASRCLECVTV